MKKEIKKILKQCFEGGYMTREAEQKNIQLTLSNEDFLKMKLEQIITLISKEK